MPKKRIRFFFIEVKDPDNPCTPLENKVQFREQLISGKLIPSLVEKYRHTHWFYLHTDSTEKPIYYVVLLSLASLDPALLVTKQDELRRSLPQQHPQWVKPCVKDCIVLNEDSYKAYFGGHALKRVSGK